LRVDAQIDARVAAHVEELPAGAGERREACVQRLLRLRDGEIAQRVPILERVLVPLAL
jgi:hypothetical protein